MYLYSWLHYILTDLHFLRYEIFFCVKNFIAEIVTIETDKK